MVIRKGLGKGKGSGYYNILKAHDHRVHQRAGKGISQPQRMSIMPPARISYNPLGYLKSHGYKIVKKPKDAQYQGVGEEGVFFYSKKTGRTYIQSDDGKYYAKKGGRSGGKDMPVTEIEDMPLTKPKASLFKKAKKLYKQYQGTQKERKIRQFAEVKKTLHPVVEKLNTQHERVETLKKQISTQEEKGMDTSSEIEELETEMEQLRELQEKATELNIDKLSNAELRTLAIRAQDGGGFFAGLFGSGQNEYEEELLRRVKKERMVDRNIQQAKKEPLEKEGLF